MHSASNGGALILGAHVVYAKGDGGGGGGGGGNGGGGSGGGGNAGGGDGKGSGSGGSGGSGKGGSAGGGASGGASGIGGGEGRAADSDQGSGGIFARVMRSFGLASTAPRIEPVVAPSRSLVGSLPPNARRIGTPGVPALALRVPPQETQAFRFDVGTAVFPTTGGMLTTEEVDGVDLVTVDARHHRVIHPAAFFEPHEGAQYDRRTVERFWPIALGKHVRFVETVGTERWLHVMSAVRAETVSVPAGEFHAFVVERTMQRIGAGSRSVATYTYWYAPDAGAIVKTELRPGNGEPAVTEDADVIGYPLPRPVAASSDALD
ncbi:MAG TPA: hypothetical protein VNW24_16170 [Stellaceae bacterium]|nr:hypothetical protein [Stellaceae bacterium]